MVFTLQANMNRGEITPYLHARADIEHYAAGLALARNVVPLRFGGITRCPGTMFGGETKSQVDADTTVWIPFRFNRQQVYAVETGDLYFRFWVIENGVPAQIELAGTPVEVVSPYATADLPNINWVQSSDVLYLFCDGYVPRKLTRNSETSWSLSTYASEDGPYLDINVTSTTLTPADTGHATPKMTSNTTPASYVISVSGGDTSAYLLFDRNKPGNVTIDAGSSGWVKVDLGSGNAKVVDAYWITSAKDNTRYDDMFTQWTLEGSNDDVTYATLDSQDGQTGWAGTETRYFEFENQTAYRYYRLSISGGGGDDGSDVDCAEIALHQAASDQTSFNLTASSVTGINEGAGFQDSDVGRPIRLFGSDGVWRTAIIASRTSTTVVKVTIGRHALPDKSPILLWRLGAWSTESGWPKLGAIYEDRLIGIGTDSDPIGGWGSKIAEYADHGISDPLVDDDAVSWRLTGGELNEAVWALPGRDLLIGTGGALRAVGRNDNNKAFSPTNIRQRVETAVSCAPVKPVQVGDMTLLIDADYIRLYEAAYTYEREGYVAKEASTLNEHLFAFGVEQIAWQKNPHNLLWSRLSDGRLLCSVYDRDQQVFGTSLIDIGGVVESILALPGNRRTDLFLIVKRTVNGSTARYVECLAEFWREDYTQMGVPVYGACSVVYDGAAANSITGIDHLEGEAVGVWADGHDFEDLSVAAGAITLPNDIEATQVVIGLRMEWTAKTLRLTNFGNRDGTGLGRSMMISSAKIDLLEAAGVKVGSVSGTDLLRFEDEINQDPFGAVPLRTGMFELGTEDNWLNGGQCVMTGNSMYPATIRAISLSVEGAD